MRIYAPEGRVPVERVRKVCLMVREEHRWTQGQLALKLGVQRKVIERIEQRAVQTVAKGVADNLNTLLDAIAAVAGSK